MPGASDARSKDRKRSLPTKGASEHEVEQGRRTSLHAHNLVEKRYRINISNKIAMLRDSVPGLRSKKPDDNVRDDNNDVNNLQRSAPGSRINKATVLDEATRYIQLLERNVSVLQDEQAQLKDRLTAYKKLVEWSEMHSRKRGDSVDSQESVPPET